jgi:hypothetical protein
MKRIATVLIAAAALAYVPPAQAQLRKLVGEAAEFAAKKMFSGAARKGAQEASELAGKKGLQFLAKEAREEGAEFLGKKAAGAVARSGLQEGAELAARKGAQAIGRKVVAEGVESVGKVAGKAALSLSDDAASAISKHGSAVAAPLIGKFGDDGAKAILKLSPRNARRMTMMTDELAASGRGSDLLAVVAEKGDAAAGWLWRNKGSVAVGSVAVAFLANPEAFLSAGESVATTAITSTTQDVAKPLIEQTAKHVAPAMIDKVVAPVAVKVAEPVARHLLLWLYVVLGSLPLLGCIAWCWYVQPSWSWLQKLRQKLMGRNG